LLTQLAQQDTFLGKVSSFSIFFDEIDEMAQSIATIIGKSSPLYKLNLSGTGGHSLRSKGLKGIFSAVGNIFLRKI